MRVLVACERSGVVRNAFLEAGHIAYSCDLEPSDCESFGHHIQGDAIEAAYSMGPWVYPWFTNDCSGLAMPFGPLWRASHRATLRCLGLSAPVAIAVFCVVYFVAELARGL